MSKRLALLAGLACLAAPAGAQAASVGINVPGGAAAINQAALAASTGASTARVFLIYPGGSSPDAGTIANYAGLIAAFNARGVKPVIDITGMGAPPADVNSFASYAGTLARIFGGSVAAWEIWNEPDEAVWWGQAGGDPAVYAQLLKATYPRVHPYAPVFLGGLTGNNYGFLEQVYSALGGNSAGAFDGVATHTDTACSVVGPDSYFRDPNGRIDRYSFLGLREVHQSMVDHGDGAKPIWITELGWSTAGGLCQSGMWAGQKPAGVSEDDQAKFMLMAWHCLKDYPYVTNALWFNLSDDGPDPYGLLRADGSSRPALAAFKQIASGQDPDAGVQCGDFTPPSISVSTPTNNGVFTDVLPIQVSATDPNGVGRITLMADGQKIRNFTTGLRNASEFPKTLTGNITWQGAKRLSYGRHTIQVVALDASGNQATTNITLTKVDPSKIGALKTKFAPLVLRGHGARRTVSTKVLAAVSGTIGFRAVHHIKVVFQKKVHGHWKTAHKYSKSAKAPLKLAVRLQHASWRVQAIFPAKAPFKGSKTHWKYFKV